MKSIVSAGFAVAAALGFRISEARQDLRHLPNTAPSCRLPGTGSSGQIDFAKDIGDSGKHRPLRNAVALFKRSIDVPLAGTAARIDFQSIDTSRNRLFVADPAPGALTVFDVRVLRIVKPALQISGIAVVLPVPALNRLYASGPGGHDLTIVDLSRFEVTGSVNGLGPVAAMTYANGAHRLFAVDSATGTVTVIDAASNQVVTRIPLGGNGASAVYDATSGCVIVSVPDRGQIVAIDPGGASIVRVFALGGGDRPGAMSLDASDRLLFVANAGRATLETVNLKSMAIMDVASTDALARDLAFDAVWHRLYVVAGDGRVSGYDLRRSRLLRTGVFDHASAIGIAVDSRTHAIYLTTTDRDQRSVLHIFRGVAPVAPRCVFHHSTLGSPCLAKYAPTR